MRTSHFLLLAGVVSAALGAVSSAEARGFRLRGRSLAVIPVGTRAGTSAPAEAVPAKGEAAPDSGRDREGALPAVAAEDAAPVPSTKAVKVRRADNSVPTTIRVNTMVAAAEWCPTHRIVGSGAGFCDLNPQSSR